MIFLRQRSPAMFILAVFLLSIPFALMGRSGDWITWQTVEDFPGILSP